MRGKDYNTGLRGVLFEARHYRRMGAAVWLYAWLVLRQTHQHGTLGWVLGGAPVSYREIEDETGFNGRTLERWMQTLRRRGYIETEAAPSGVIVRITKAKKFPQPGRKTAEGVRTVAEGGPQSCGASIRKVLANEQLAARISSSSVAGSKERKQFEIHNHPSCQIQFYQGQDQTRAPNPSGVSQEQNQRQNFFFESRMLQQLRRAEREEAVRRELAVGTGPEVQRS